MGTLKATSGHRLGRRLEGLDTPTLKGLWQTAPYLHDGSAPSLQAVLTIANGRRRHGDLHAASPAQIRDLVAYLLQIDDREPGPPSGTLSLRILAPADEARFVKGTAVAVEVEARSDLGPLRGVWIRDGGVVVGVHSVAPFTFNWRATTTGTHVLSALAVHGNGTRTQSLPVRVVVEKP